MSQQKGLCLATECYDSAYSRVRSSKTKWNQDWRLNKVAFAKEIKIEAQKWLNRQAFANRLQIDKYRHSIKEKESIHQLRRQKALTNEEKEFVLSKPKLLYTFQRIEIYNSKT